MLSCCGFELEGNPVLDFGSITGCNANSRIDEAHNKPMTMALAYLGPMFLKEVVEKVAPEVSFPERYASMCEVCQSVVCNPDAIAALRSNANLYVPATKTVASLMEKKVG